MSQEPSEFQTVIERFLRLYDDHPRFGPINDEAFMRDAVMVFSIGTFRNPTDPGFSDAYRKAARAIAKEFMRPPDRKTGLISFPSPFFDKDKMLSPAEMKRRNIGFKMCEMVKAGTPVTHAAAIVAAELHFSPQKVTKDYYDWKDYFDAIDRLARGEDSKNAER
ncbi:hypothetical protein [Achromobacter ruhlandii]|uniref:hypothetical protein n=1 Tax=Achromobacter ruhlandii TaxID=72557 RepID=UPI001EEF2936|nr:hypothetical protein [Achromobacter ruhlandii]MCZ8395880.1 hypothetical protein [Achromobacter ruhlandii]